MKGRYILRKDRKPNDLGEYCINLYYSTNSTPIRKSMGIYIHPDLWLGDDGTSSQYILGGCMGHPKADLYNKILDSKKQEVDSIINLLEQEAGFKMTVPLLRSILNGSYHQDAGTPKGKVSFVDEVLSYNQSLYNKGKISFSVWSNIQCSIGIFKKFLQKEKGFYKSAKSILYCCDISVKIIDDYIYWRKERGNTNDTINKALTPIFKTVRKLISCGWINQEVGNDILESYLPTQVKSLTSPTDEVNYLTIEQVRNLIELTKASKYPRTKELMDMFLFSLHCGGMRFSDICTLRWVEINLAEKLIKHLQVKNHTRRPTILNYCCPIKNFEEA